VWVWSPAMFVVIRMWTSSETSWFQADIVQAKVGGEHQHKDGDHTHAY
jgi:hypothetical protein